jgi:hypothetical protein
VTSHRALVLVLRFSGAVLLLAFGAMFLPTDWMAATFALTDLFSISASWTLCSA